MDSDLTSRSLHVRLDRVSAEFSALDQATARERIRALSDSGFAEGDISTLTGYAINDVRRALAGRL